MSTTSLAMPDARTLQRQEALQTAQTRRLYRAAIKATLKDSTTYQEATAKLADVLDREATNPAIANAPITELLNSCSRLQVRRKRHILREIEATDGRLVRELSERQLVKLVYELRNPSVL